MSTVANNNNNSNQENGDNHLGVMAACPKVGRLTDRFGNNFFIGVTGSFWMPPFPIGPDNDYRSHVNKITNMDIRDDDILVCTYPKAGLHWHVEIMNMLRYNCAEYCIDNFFKYSLDTNRNHPTGEADPGKPRILLTHLPFSHIPKQALKKKIKILVLTRNPKDVMVSFYVHMHNHTPPLNFPGTFEQFVRLTLECGYYFGSWFDHTMSFQRGMKEYPDVQFHPLMYEDMIKDPIGGVKKLNILLGTGCSENMCKEIADKCSIKMMKPFKEANKTEMEKAMFKEGTTSFYRRGEIGDWKNWFSPELTKDFEDMCTKCLAGCTIKFQYE